VVNVWGLVWLWAPPAAAAPPRFHNVRPASGAAGIRFEIEGQTGAGERLPVGVTVCLADDANDVLVEFDSPRLEAKVDEIPALDALAADGAGWLLAVTDRANGHLYPLTSEYPADRRFVMWDVDMPWVGVCDPATGAGYAIIFATPDDGLIELQSVGDAGGLVPAAKWAGSHGRFSYPRRLIYHFTADGGHVALAKRYRKQAKELGLIVTLEEKARRNPEVGRLFGAPIIWGGGLEFALEAKAAGVERMVFYGGFGNEVPPEDVSRINELGYLTSVYDNYTDVMNLKPGEVVGSSRDVVPDHCVLQANGERMKAWMNWDGSQFMKRCPSFWLLAAEIVVPRDRARFPRLARFIDVSTAEGLYECYDPAHPLTRGQKRQCGADLLEYVKSLGLVAGGEHGRWWAVPHLEYLEGMMSGGWDSWPSGHLTRPDTKEQAFQHPGGYVYPKWPQYEQWGIGHRYRAPLWELVFHDCVVTTWYWGDSNDFLLKAAPEMTARKDAFNVLYGTAPMMWANAEGSWLLARDVFLRSYRNTCKLHAAVAGTEMLTHEFVTPDRSVQRTRFSDGTQAVVNFGEPPQQVELAGQAYLLPQHGFAVRGPVVDQSLSLADGQPVTRIRAADCYSFTDSG